MAAIIYCVIQGLKGGDFKIYMGAAELLHEGKSCYNEWILLGGENYGQYSYSPFFASLLIPFTYLPKGSAQILWLLVNLFFLQRVFSFIRSFLHLDRLSLAQQYLWGFITLLLSLRFVLHNFEMVQMTIFLLFCCTEAVRQTQQKRAWLSGLLLALGIVVKILPLVMIPYFIYRNQWKPLPYLIGFVIILLLFPAVFFGWEMNQNLLSDWWGIINPSNTEFVAEQNKFGEGIHSLSGLLAAYFSDTPSFWGIEEPRIIKVLSAEKLSIMLSSLRLLFILFTLYFLRTLPFRAAKSSLHQLWELSYILGLVPLIFPHQQKYAFFFLTPAIAYVVYQWISSNRPRLTPLLLSLFFLLAVFTTDGIVGDQLNDLSEHYKTITFGTFCLLIALASCRPKALK
ncbi:MAG: glycosyltransferase family 87 protein [Vicingaceae bacterium]